MLVILLLTAIPLCFVVANSLTIRRVSNKDAASVDSKVSILIPMRNEEKNVAGVLESVSTTEFLPHHEIIVLDDHSTDATSNLLTDFAGIQTFPGIELPEGWFGKNFACHQLVTHSTGDYLVFVDADVRLTKNAIAAAITDMNKFGWDFI